MESITYQLYGKLSHTKIRNNYFLLKRMFDIFFSVLFLILSMPLLLLISFVIKLTSKGSIFYVQERIGINGNRFQLLKFRTMFENAEDNGPVWSSENDNRITGCGKILRDFGLDEIPQFINVLMNDMSIMGPRPERTYFVNLLIKQIPNYSHRLSVKPGITGLAQVRYKSDQSIDDVKRKLKYDIFYINNLSLPLDFFIMTRTINILMKKISKYFI
jgi:lipopolysaccharide/colanic/teichoic acid biosynthesis glycosyltransferase